VIVFVHGVPETPAVWDPVRARLEEPSVALALPGFGCPRPTAFGATMDDYAAWLVGQLEDVGEPVYLVGHDWGAGLTYRVATAYGGRLRGWIADVANVVHPHYVWHDFARRWQTPVEGERFFEQLLATPMSVRVAYFEREGVGHDDAVVMARHQDQTMNSCILDLYRSATPNPYAHWGDALAPTASPGLVVSPLDDPFGDDRASRHMAARLGAEHRALAGAGHWWPLQSPDTAAALVREFVGSH
jgi:pimeloyl-ACP methyl ester carboxylesterase